MATPTASVHRHAEQNIPMNYLSALEVLDREHGNLAGKLEAVGLCSNHIPLPAINAVTCARGRGGSSVFLMKRRRERNKQTPTQKAVSWGSVPNVSE